jgi:hypothetical protein
MYYNSTEGIPGTLYTTISNTFFLKKIKVEI